VARDDDFTKGILQSRPFALWWSQLKMPRAAPLAVESFPFPWPPATALSALTAAQEEQRHAIARAARNSDVEQLNSAVLTAYGWPTELDDQALLDKLAGLNRTRSG